MTQNADLQELQNQEVSAEDQKHLILYLEELLLHEIEKLRNYDIDGAMALAEEVNTIASQVTAQKIFENPEFEDEKFRIKRLYKDLELIIASERAEISEKLKQVRQGIRTLEVYGDSN